MSTAERVDHVAVGDGVGAGRTSLPSRLADRLPVPVLVAALAIAAVVARLPGLTRPLSNDEGGFLMVAAQWAPGSSLYGNYWVDRPPLIVGLYQLADLLGGGPVGLRLLGAAWVGMAVVLAAVLGRVAGRLGDPRTPRLSPVWPAATAAVFLVSPMFGASEVDGELLAVPFVLAGITAVLKAHLPVSAKA